MTVEPHNVLHDRGRIQVLASFHKEGVDAFTLEEILASVFDPSVDGTPSRTIDYGQPGD